jgi:hypothetical protein
MMNHEVRLLAFSLLSAFALTLLGGLLYNRFEGGLNDYYYYSGFPLSWALNHLETYRNYTTIWSFNVLNFILDVAFFFVFSFAFWGIILQLRDGHLDS